MSAVRKVEKRTGTSHCIGNFLMPEKEPRGEYAVGNLKLCPRMKVQHFFGI